MTEKKETRRHSPEFRIEIAQRMLAGENVLALSTQYKLPRSMMYRWRETYRKQGPAGLSRDLGRPTVSGATRRGASDSDQRLRRQISDLQRQLGEKTAEIDFFRGVFERLKELPKTNPDSGKASTPRSDE